MAPTGLQLMERQGGILTVTARRYFLITYLSSNYFKQAKLTATIDSQRTAMCQYFHLTIITSSTTVKTD